MKGKHIDDVCQSQRVDIVSELMEVILFYSQSICQAVQNEHNITMKQMEHTKNVLMDETDRLCLPLREKHRSYCNSGLRCFCCLGMGVPTVTATRILKGQLSGQRGEESQLEMDKFPFVSLSKVSLAIISYRMPHCIDLALAINGFPTGGNDRKQGHTQYLSYWKCIMLQNW